MFQSITTLASQTLEFWLIVCASYALVITTVAIVLAVVLIRLHLQGRIAPVVRYPYVSTQVALEQAKDQAKLLSETMQHERIERIQNTSWLMHSCEQYLSWAYAIQWHPLHSELQTLKQHFAAATASEGAMGFVNESFYQYQAQRIMLRLLEELSNTVAYLQTTSEIYRLKQYNMIHWLLDRGEQLPATEAQKCDLRVLQDAMATVDATQLHTVDLGFYEQWAQEILCERMENILGVHPSILPQGITLDAVHLYLGAAEVQWREIITFAAASTQAQLLSYLADHCDAYDHVRTMSRFWLNQDDEKVQIGEYVGKTMKHWACVQALVLILTSPYELKNSDLIEMQFEMFRRNLIQQASYDLKRLAQRQG